MGDEVNFRRLGESVRMIELMQSFQEKMTVVQGVDLPDSPVDELMGVTAARGAVDRWADRQARIVR